MQNLITQHLDIWTAAHKTRSSAGRGSSNKLDLYGIKKLRELILELAVRGKLVPQDVNDEPASELLKSVTLARAKLINKGLIKKDRLFTAIEEDEKPFGLPASWQWVRLPEVCSFKPGKTPDTKNSSYWTGTGVPWVNIADMEHYGTVTSTGKTISIDAAEKVFGGETVKAGSIIMSFKLTVGKISKLGIDAYHNEAIISLNPFDGISKEFIFRFLPSRAQAGNTKKAIMGNTLNSESLALLLIPLPPLAEQHRIVAKVDELMAFCDQLEQTQSDNIAVHAQLVEALLTTLTDSRDHNELQNNWQRIAAHFDTLFTTEHAISQLKQTILQLAVMGKLVPQNPNDEPASVLLKKIAAEKALLIKEGKIKKEKPLPEITDEEKPFELPRGWEWCRLPDVGELARGKSKHRPRNDPKLFANGTIPLIQTGDVARSEKTIQTYSALYNDFGLAQSRLWPKGTMCITIAANIADTGILGFKACFPDSVVGFVPYDKNIPVEYFESFIKVTKDHLEKFAPSTAQKNINLEILGDLLVPCPPANEINRIVTKVDELMTLCDTLKTNLQNAQTTQLALADALVESAIGVSHSSSVPAIKEEPHMEITTLIELSPDFKIKSDAILANIISNEGGSIGAKRLWKQSNLDLPGFYKQLKKEISAGYIVKPGAAELK